MEGAGINLVAYRRERAVDCDGYGADDGMLENLRDRKDDRHAPDACAGEQEIVRA